MSLFIFIFPLENRENWKFHNTFELYVPFNKFLEKFRLWDYGIVLHGGFQ